MGSIVEVVDFILHIGQCIIHPLHKNILGIMISRISSLNVHGVDVKAIKYVLKINFELDLQYVALSWALNSTPVTISTVGSF